MNREILFRAKRKDNGEWVEGYYVPHIVEGKIVHHFILTGESDLVETEDDELILKFYWEEIDPDTLCQYTGLTDKNGQKIWENDIVRNEEGDIGVVQWFEEHAAFMIWNKTKNCVCYLAENDFSKIEIVGNEFDNPELLEVE